MEKELFGVTEGIICQQNNCRGAYGAGLSGAISDKFPEVYQEFRQFNEIFPNPDDQLGRHQIVVLDRYDDTQWVKLAVANIYTQKDYGGGAKFGKVYTNTPLLVENIREIAEMYPDLPVYIPHSVDKNGKHNGIGCGLAGEKWENLYPQLQALKLDNLYLLDTFTGEREKVHPFEKGKDEFRMYISLEGQFGSLFRNDNKLVFFDLKDGFIEKYGTNKITSPINIETFNEMETFLSKKFGIGDSPLWIIDEEREKGTLKIGNDYIASFNIEKGEISFQYGDIKAEKNFESIQETAYRHIGLIRDEPQKSKNSTRDKSDYERE